MENTTLKFKTNINCGGCIKAVGPSLNQAEEIASWTVDTDNPDKILTVESTGIRAEKVEEIVKKAGFSIEKI